MTQATEARFFFLLLEFHLKHHQHDTTTRVTGIEMTQNIQKRDERWTPVLLSSSAAVKSKKELLNTVAMRVLGKKTNVMRAMVCIERLSSCVTMLNAY